MRIISRIRAALSAALSAAPRGRQGRALSGHVMAAQQFPHCDRAVLHEPGTCRYCDRYPEWQGLRDAWGIAFTGRAPTGDQLSCPSDFRRGLAQAHLWPGNRPGQG